MELAIVTSSSLSQIENISAVEYKAWQCHFRDFGVPHRVTNRILGNILLTLLGLTGNKDKITLEDILEIPQHLRKNGKFKSGLSDSAKSFLDKNYSVRGKKKGSKNGKEK